MEAKAKNVVGVYETEQEAIQAVESLKKKGIHQKKYLSSANIKRPKSSERNEYKSRRGSNWSTYRRYARELDRNISRCRGSAIPGI